MKSKAHMLAVLAVTLACDGSPTSTSFAMGPLQTRDISLPSYILWWSELEECVGISGDFHQLRVVEVLAPLTESKQQFPCFSDGRLCSGVWVPPKDIFLASGMINNERTVKHEMLHALLQSPQHGTEFFACTGPRP